MNILELVRQCDRVRVRCVPNGICDDVTQVHILRVKGTRLAKVMLHDYILLHEK